MTPGTVRGLLTSKSLNLRIVIERAVGNCRNYALAFDDAHNLLPPAAQLFATPDLPVVLNSLHILGRLLPFLLEPHGDVEVEAELAALFWTGETHRTVHISLAPRSSRLSPRVPAGGLAHYDLAAAPATQSDDRYDSLTLGQKIMYVSAAVLFKPGFAVQVRRTPPATIFVTLLCLLTMRACRRQPLPTTTVGGLLHASGLQGIVPVQNASDSNDTNCCAALRVILTCFCETLYFDSNSGAAQGRHDPQENQWLRWARSSGFGPLSQPLFASLLNVALGEQTAAFSEGGWMPYGHFMSSAQGRDVYVGISLHILLLLLDSSEKGGLDRRDNIFWVELESLEDYYPVAGGAAAAAAVGVENDQSAAVPVGVHPGNFAKILRGFEALLGQPAVASNSILPASVQAIRCTDELLVLLWNMLCGNHAFRTCVQSVSCC